MQQWLTKVGQYRVEHMPMPHLNARTDLSRREGVLHTTEGSLESALNVFRVHFAPNFTIGLDRGGKVRVIQHIPLGFMAAALENDAGGVQTNLLADVQIEIVAHSKTHAWLPDVRTTDALAETMVALRRVVDIPLFHPFPENPGMLPWASERYWHRTAGKWGKTPGWYAHMDVPENVHWDCGWLKWETLMNLCHAKSNPPAKDGSAAIRELAWKWARWYLGIGEFTNSGPKKGWRPNLFPEGAATPADAKRAVEWYKKHVRKTVKQTDRIRTFALSRAASSASPAPLCLSPGDWVTE